MLKQFICSLLVILWGSFAMAENTTRDLENTLYLDLKDGRVVIETFPDLAPKHVARIKELAREKFYDGVVFHRVIEGFMAQAGDPTGTGMGGSDKLDLVAEFSDKTHARGIVSMARRGNDVNSANSQFFIVFEDSPFLDNQYTVWGEVVDGMQHVDAIKRGAGANGMVQDPDAIISFRVAADVEQQQTKEEVSSDTQESSAGE